MKKQQTSPQSPAIANIEGPATVLSKAEGPVLSKAEGLPSTYLYATRHDGWTGEKMAIFCEALAETAIVADACEIARMGMYGAYAARRRIPAFAAAWDAALGIARERLADTLLERAMTGTRDLFFKDGEVVGERHFIDNRLGWQVLRRLDRQAEFPGAGRGPGQRDTAASQRLGPGLRQFIAHSTACCEVPAMATGGL